MDRRARRPGGRGRREPRGRPGRGAAPGRPAGRRRAPPVRPRHLAVPHPGAGRRPPGPHPPARDGTGRRGGTGGAGPGRQPPGPGTVPRWCASISGPVRGRSPCRWPPRARRMSAGARRSGPPTGRPRPSRWPGRTSTRLAATDPAAAGRVTLAGGLVRRPARPRWPDGSTWWWPIRPTWPRRSTRPRPGGPGLGTDRGAGRAPGKFGCGRDGRHGGGGRGRGPLAPPAGALVVEFAPSQAYGAIDVARRAGFARVRTARDLAGRLRMLVAER